MSGVRVDEKSNSDDDCEFYDSTIDEKNEAWARDSLFVPLSSDATDDEDSHKSATESPRLSCPSCFALLCVDAQKHESNPQRHRAMFVHNCLIHHAEKSVPIAHDDGKTYRPVTCALCGAHVAAYDPEREVYHYYDGAQRRV